MRINQEDKSVSSEEDQGKSEKISTASLFRDQWYRFFIDAHLLRTEEGYEAYEEREPGAVESGKKAIYALLDELEKPQNARSMAPVTEDLIHEIHAMVKGHQKDAGVYRQHLTGLFLVVKQKQFNRIDFEGAKVLKDFIPENWASYIGLARYEEITHLQCITPAIRQIKKANDEELSAFFFQENAIIDFDFDTVFYRAPESESISSLISSSISQYNQSIEEIGTIWTLFFRKAAYKDPESIDEFKQWWRRQLLRAIVQLAKEVDLIHPFSDGNTRTALILIQRELIRHQCVPAIIADPNTLEVLSIDEFIDKQLVPGISYTQALSKDPGAAICGYEHVSENERVSHLSIFRHDQYGYNIDIENKEEQPDSSYLIKDFL